MPECIAAQLLQKCNRENGYRFSIFFGGCVDESLYLYYNSTSISVAGVRRLLVGGEKVLKQFMKRLDKLWSLRKTSSYLAYLRKAGMRIGEGTEVFARPTNVLIDTTRPWLIEIGKNVQITAGVKILTHGNGRAPEKSALSEFFWLFEERNALTEPSFVAQMKNMQNYEASMERYMQTKPIFDGYSSFLDYCFADEKVPRNA